MVPHYLCILSRIAISDAAFLVGYIRQAGRERGEEGTVGRFVAVWVDRFECTAAPAQRKLLAMGLGAMVATGDGEVAQHLLGIIGVWSDVLSEVQESEGGEYVNMLLGIGWIAWTH
jgi:hypothetical protein